MSNDIALEIEKIRGLVSSYLKDGASLESLNECRVTVFGKKGAMTNLQKIKAWTMLMGPMGKAKALGGVSIPLAAETYLPMQPRMLNTTVITRAALRPK